MRFWKLSLRDVDTNLEMTGGVADWAVIERTSPEGDEKRMANAITTVVAAAVKLNNGVCYRERYRDQSSSKITSGII